MSILKGSLTFSQYRIEEELPKHFLDFVREKLNSFSFSTLNTAERRKTVGWTSMEDILDTSFQMDRFIKGDFLLFSLRVDQKNIPPSLLKIETMKAEKHCLQETGKDRLYKEQKQDIRDRMQSFLLEKTLAVPSFYDVCWSVSGKWIIFTSLAETACLDFLSSFKDSFGFFPIPISAEKLLEVSTAPQTPEHIIADPQTIGREFMTWLWFKAEERNGFIALTDQNEIELHFLRRLVLESGGKENSETVTCYGINTDLKEGKEALRQGKKIKEGRIRLRIDADSWEFTFKADPFGFQSMKLPETLPMADETDTDGRILERIYLIDKIIKVMNDLFSLFLTIRRSPLWLDREQPRMKIWLQE